MPALSNRIAPVGLFGLFSLMLFLVPRIAGSLGIKNRCSFVRYLVIWLFGYLVTWLLGYLVTWLFGYLVIWFSSCSSCLLRVGLLRFKVQGSRFKVYAFTFHLS